ncbi:putative acylphosphatase [Botrytis fragariae]|uniref:acylphosphatase n=1 Tax=Botrytis fragariae TaxID=1964551 RepID=A0A8H6ART6_9HELO|nr:putative acylphosphatase [Botrytis fragariae]KAF5872442.1 putative acylphosphatase [Botrytis fragariae]
MDHDEKLDKRIAFTVSGKVQEFSGVNFRWFTQKKARALGVVGWVRNTDNGKVKGEAQGSASQIESLRADLKEGPSHANVTGYEDTELDLKEKGVAEERFEVVR